MGVFTEIAQRQDRDETEALNHLLLIGGEDHSKHLISASVTYTTDVGGSGLELEYQGVLDSYTNAPVVLSLGYGDKLVPYFVGRIRTIKDNDEIGICSATAFGPFRVMAEQIIGKAETFQGLTLEYVIMELAYRAKHDAGDVVVYSGNRYSIPAGELFPFDTTCGDVLGSLMEKAEFVGVDQPGGKRVFMPRPRPGGNVKHKAIYQPNHYMSLVVEPKEDTIYHSVVVYRNAENGAAEQDVYAEQVIAPFVKYPPPRWNVYTVPDFPGTQADAGDKAYEIATDLRAGEFTFSMSTLFNPDITLWDGYRVVKPKRLSGGGWERRVYSCTVDSSITVTYSPGEATMDITGSAYELRRERISIDTPNYKEKVLSSGVVRITEDDTPDITIDDTLILIDDPDVRF